jgi:uncharacterized protein YndB with AHSA1/START domain
VTAAGADSPGCLAQVPQGLLARWRHTFEHGTATSVDIDAERRVVFDHLVEPRTFPDWLVGAQHIRATDDGWPAAGTAFHHRVGFGPLTIEDSTHVVEVDRPDVLVLEAAIGPFGSARVRFRLDGSDPTTVTFEEVPSSGPVRLMDRTAGHLVARASIWGRNRASLERLKILIEQRSPGAR